MFVKKAPNGAVARQCVECCAIALQSIALRACALEHIVRTVAEEGGALRLGGDVLAARCIAVLEEENVHPVPFVSEHVGLSVGREILVLGRILLVGIGESGGGRR